MADGSLLITLRTCARTVEVCAPTALEALFRSIPREVCDARLASWSRDCLDIAGIDRFIEGTEHLVPGESYVVISNHQSTYDIMLLIDAYPGTLRMVSKKEMFDVPFVGRAMAAAEFVRLDRANREEAKESLRQAAARLASGVSVWIAPEGTRSPDGRLLPFKGGAFWLALETGARILPTTVVGSRDVLPSKGVRVRSGQRAGVRFHAPVDPREYGKQGRSELLARVRDAIAAGLPEELASTPDAQVAESA
jgi:1-acyl-sn-glycerol-3-phosphate acyltransferase